MTSLLFWRTRSSWSTPPRKCCHGNSKGSTIKLLPFNKFLDIFRNGYKIWLNYLSPSLSYVQKTSRSGAEHPPPLGRVGLTNPCQWTRMLRSSLINSFMLTHRELKVRFLNRSEEKNLSSDVYFAYLALMVFFFMTDLKKVVAIP